LRCANFTADVIVFINPFLIFLERKLSQTMKFLATQVTYFLSQNQTRQNIRALLKYLLFLTLTIAVFSILFHFIMLYEGREFSWLTGVYWTLVVMSTLGFGDVTFHSDLGRFFSIVVLMSGIVLLLIMLPFAFIRFFYAPWLEAQIHTQAPRKVPHDTKGHVIICVYNSIAEVLIERLKHNKIPYFVIETDSIKAADFHHDGVSVVYGEIDSRKTYESLQAQNARLIFANAEDTTNTNITLTIREIAPNVPIAATANDLDSIDILEFSGATNVLPLKQRLGEHLANRISIGNERIHVIGNFDDWLVFEFMVSGTKLENEKLLDTNLRKETGINIVGAWEKGHLIRATPETVLSNSCVPVAVGTQEQIDKLEVFLGEDEPCQEAVLLIGAGKVGRAAARQLKKQGHQVFMVDQKKTMKKKMGDVPDRFVVGDAADSEVLFEAGLNEASLIVLSTNDDAVNIYLSIYCRRLKPDAHIISRLTHERNLEAIHRAGADFALSYSPLGAESIISIIQNREPVIMGEGVEFFTVNLPSSLVDKTLQESRIGSLTGLTVLAVRIGDEAFPNPLPTTVLPKNCKMNVLGTSEQLEKYKEIF